MYMNINFPTEQTSYNGLPFFQPEKKKKKKFIMDLVCLYSETASLIKLEGVLGTPITRTN